jgi:hypothetical protein
LDSYTAIVACFTSQVVLWIDLVVGVVSEMKRILGIRSFHIPSAADKSK